MCHKTFLSRHRIKYFGVVTAAAATTLLCGVATAAIADQPASTDQSAPAAPAPEATESNTGDISLGGRVVMRLRVGSGGLSVQERANKVYDRLTRILSIEELMPEDVRVRPNRYGPTIFVRDEKLLTVDEATAQASGTTPDALAQAWARNLAEIIPSVNVRRRGETLGPPSLLDAARGNP
jgi:hypothetical protein